MAIECITTDPAEVRPGRRTHGYRRLQGPLAARIREPMPNHLATETSPYLRQHADNPVDWYPWGREALERARNEDRPILLSVGYAACHWCHVMAHESFEDPDTARLMNELFVNIKVDREERPDVDSVYMQAVQSMTGHGGWPMTMFLTPAGEPFYAGTYFPPVDRQGMPSFARILRSVSDAYHTKRDRVTQTAAAMRDIYAAASAPMPPSGTLGPATLDRAYHGLAERFDSEHGGFEGAPKFPQTMSLDFLLRYATRMALAAGSRDGRGDVSPHGARRHLRPGRRRVPPLRGRRGVARAAFREDAVRQRTARPARRAPLAGHGRSPRCAA